MKYHKIYFGDWTPGSTIHLKELYSLFVKGSSSYFEKDQLVSKIKSLKIKKIAYKTQALNLVQGVLDNNINFDVLEDGAAMVSLNIKSFDREQIKKLKDFAISKLFLIVDKVYSSGVSVPKILDELQVDNPMVLVTSGATQKDLEDLFKKTNSIAYKKLDVEQGDVWIGSSFVVINSIKFSEEELEQAVRYLMFARLFELNLKRSLQAQQKLWSRLENIRNLKFIKNKDLPKVRDLALDAQSQVGFFKNRSNQMDRFLEWRKNYIDEYLSDHFLSSAFKEFFFSLKTNQHYLHELWSMTDSYAASTVESISLSYIDNERKELRTLQKLFLISAVTTFISMGTLLGAKMTTYDNNNQVTSVSIFESWDMYSLGLFGFIALLVSLLIYYFLYLGFSRLKQSEIVSKQKSKK